MIATLALVAFLSWRLMTSESFSRGPGRVRSLGLELEEMRIGEPVVGLEVAGDARDAFVRPQDDFPLEPLSLPAPPLVEMPDLLPPPIPDSGADHWSAHLYQRAEAPRGDLNDLIDPSEVDLASDEDISESSSGLGEEEGFGDIDYSTQYDSLKIDAIRAIYGFILDDDVSSRYDKRVGDTIRFQEVRPSTGEERFAPRDFTSEDYQSFAFAKTLRNEIELKSREMRGASAGRTVELRDHVAWLLESGMREPVAFGYAEERARQLITLAPDDALNWLALGAVWERTFRFDEAFTMYAQLAGEPLPDQALDLGLDIQGGRFETVAGMRVAMARILRRIGVDQDAENLLRRADALQPGDATALTGLGVLLLDQGRASEALEPLERVAAMPFNRSSQIALRAGYELGRAYLTLGRWDDASKAFSDNARAAGSDLRGAIARQGEVAAAYLGGKFGEAQQLADDAITEDGALPALLYLRGLATGADGGSAAEMVRDLRAAAEGAPLDAAPPLAALAFYYDLMGMGTEADETLARALELDPELPYARYLQARWAARDGQLDEASATLRSLVARSPRCAAALAELGWLLHQQSAYEAAEVAFRRAVAAQPNNPSDPEAWSDLTLRRGLNQVELSDWEAAGNHFREALELQPSLYAAQNGLALVAYSEGDLAQAISDFSYLQDNLRQLPDDPQAQYAAVWQERAQKHATLRLWEDPFDGNRLRPGWEVQQDARNGVGPALREGRLTIVGNHQDQGITRASRQVTALHFQSFGGDLLVGDDHRGDAGLMLAIETRQGRQTWFFKVFRDREGSLVYHTKQGAKEDRRQLSRRITPGIPVRVTFELDREPTTPVLTVRVDDSVVYSEPAPVLKSAAGALVYGVYAETSNALPVDTSLDNVSVIYAKP
ncbi:MAG: tetratricopeptide repeat protein [Planctomycetes bacterium]|nr:tetratricopeptide repeat protein [Planctomycetota bacterium]